MKNQRMDPDEAKLVKFAVYLFLSMAIYIILVRFFVLRNHLRGNRQQREEWEAAGYREDPRFRQHDAYPENRRGRFPPPPIF